MFNDLEPSERLANAIILQAVKDWRHGAKMLKKHPDSRAGRDEVEETERFFRSEWYELLTDIDGEYLIKKLREEAGI